MKLFAYLSRLKPLSLPLGKYLKLKLRAFFRCLNKSPPDPVISHYNAGVTHFIEELDILNLAKKLHKIEHITSLILSSDEQVLENQMQSRVISGNTIA
jgi:hypothetical protein